MPLYFFHIRDGETLHRDGSGRELPGIQDVIREADEYAKGAMREAAVRGQDVSGHSLEVVDKNGEQVVTLPFARAIEDKPAESGDDD
jgi:hypothetical protein